MRGNHRMHVIRHYRERVNDDARLFCVLDNAKYRRTGLQSGKLDRPMLQRGYGSEARDYIMLHTGDRR